MDLWSTRRASQELLDSELSEQKVSIEHAFELIDKSIDFFNRKAADDQYCRICGVTLAKAKSYALGAYGMILDNLGQEAGALNRPFLEYYELIIYFSQDPCRVAEAAEDRLPKAGQRAKLIGSDLKGFREYLNQNASHSSYSYYSLRHQLDTTSLSIKKTQGFAADVLFRNLGDLFAQLLLLDFQAAVSVSVKDRGEGLRLAQEAEILRDKGGGSFRLRNRLKGGYDNELPNK